MCVLAYLHVQYMFSWDTFGTLLANHSFRKGQRVLAQHRPLNWLKAAHLK